MKIKVGVIGGGVAGLSAIFYALERGFEITLFEENQFGGKAFNGGDLYLNIFFDTIKSKTNLDTNDLQKLIEYSETNKQVFLSKYYPFLNSDNLTIVPHKASFLSENQLIANDIVYEFDYIIVAAGIKPTIPPIKGIQEAINNGYILKPNEINKIKATTKKIAIIGAGKISLELAMILTEFNIEVHIFGRKQILTNLDAETKERYLSLIKTDRLHINLNTEFQEIDNNTLYFNDTKDTFDQIILAAGFTFDPSTFSKIGHSYPEGACTDNGIIVDKYMRTKIPNIYAIGDSNILPKYSKNAIQEAFIAVRHIAGVFINNHDPFFYHMLGKYEYAYKGLSEEQIIQENIKYTKVIIEEKDIVNNHDQIKFVKLLLKENTREVLGIFLIAKDALSVMNAVLLALEEAVIHKIDNRLTLFTSSHYLTTVLRKRLELIDLNVINNIFESFYQVKVDQNKKIVGAESLARFKHNDNYLFPLPFIENFESNGLILMLDIKALENACILIKELKSENLIDEDFHISVNISSLTIEMLNYRIVKLIFDRHNIDYRYITFEVTERSTVESVDYERKLKKFKSYGFTLSMDDFSVGNSSVGLFHNVDFDEIKIDMGLLPKNEDDIIKKEAYKLLVKMIQQKNVLINAEGIEDEFQYNFVKNLGIDSFQGYYFSKPISKTNFIDLLKKNKQ